MGLLPACQWPLRNPLAGQTGARSVFANPSFPVRHLGSSHGLAGARPEPPLGLMEQAMLDLVARLEAQPSGLAARQLETANRVAL